MNANLVTILAVQGILENVSLSLDTSLPHGKSWE
jgi:hypothetical protein